MEQKSTELKLTVPWGHIAAKTYGSSTGKFVLMVHGLMDNMGAFTRLLKYLPMDTHYYVCVDLPGHGYSSRFPSWMMVEFVTYIDTIYYILEALQWKTCIFIGHSMGAQLGIFFSINRPHRIEKIIALDGLIPIVSTTDDDFIKSFKEKFMLLRQNQNANNLYTKEEALYALKNLRFAALNSDAAEALFEHFVTKVDGKYKYTRDVRLRMTITSLLSLEQSYSILRNLSVPLYVVVASSGAIDRFPQIFKTAIKSINPKSLSEIFYVRGNHDVHNNYPEKVAPFICKILLNENTSKL
ncbi:PREDICTED: serine hydrolase-like protein [Dinoponera quadriceps]|uniref:Serine hydrolase-like protein n=1 Tax=Dinoponera quadriceps TaxID=609295 RepID=A0A6P3Y708_DINQU|nr:PREDICTED: serine hydrolase-like protein [Dinoponera quadriceps]XP_014486816.1 PREDICTED: serine hydrolase-like protein [Dinoponera quadriceps]